MFRGFIAIDIGAMPEIVKFINKLKAIPGLKLVKPENVHLTLKFLGEVDEDKVDKIVEIVQCSVENRKNFKLKLKGAGAFPSLSKPRAIWIGTENTVQLLQIANYLNENLQFLGFEKEERAFSPHATIARVKFLKSKKELKEILLEAKDREFGEVEVKAIKLKKSVLSEKGPEYFTLKEISL